MITMKKVSIGKTKTYLVLDKYTQIHMNMLSNNVLKTLYFSLYKFIHSLKIDFYFLLCVWIINYIVKSIKLIKIQ